MSYLLLSPLTWALLLLVWRSAASGRRPRRLLGAGLFICWLMAAPLGANGLVWLVERRLQTLPLCGTGETAPLLMLTGGLIEAPRDADDFSAMSPASLRRVDAVVRLARDQPGTEVYFSGGPNGALAEARIAGSLARRLGLAQERLLLETRSQDTWQNADELAKILPPTSRRVQLVTSDIHAPRAALALRAHGISACRHAVDSALASATGLGYLVPQSSSIAKTERAIHELLGLASYSLKRAPDL